MRRHSWLFGAPSPTSGQGRLRICSRCGLKARLALGRQGWTVMHTGSEDWQFWANLPECAGQDRASQRLLAEVASRP